MNDEHGDSDEADHGTPFWTYSDDEDLADVAEAGANPHGWNDGLILEEVLGRPDHEGPDPHHDPQRGSPAATSREDVERLLGAESVSWTSCRRAIEAATALAAWDLVEAAALRALQVAHDGNYRSERSLAEAARQVLVAKCAKASLNGLAYALADGQARLQAVLDRARRDGRTALRNAVDGEISSVDEMLLLLASADDARALSQLASRLRRLGTPALAEEAAGRGIAVDPLNPAPWVARAAALADLRNHKGALADLDQDTLEGNIHAAVTRARVLRTIGRRREALDVALAAAQAQPSKTTLTMLTVLANDLNHVEAHAEAERLLSLVPEVPQDRSASRLLGLLAARWLATEGENDRALLLAEIVAAGGPRWQQAEALVLSLRRRTT